MNSVLGIGCCTACVVLSRFSALRLTILFSILGELHELDGFKAESQM